MPPCVAKACAVRPVFYTGGRGAVENRSDQISRGHWSKCYFKGTIWGSLDEGWNQGTSSTQDQKNPCTVSTCWINPGGLSLKEQWPWLRRFRTIPSFHRAVFGPLAPEIGSSETPVCSEFCLFAILEGFVRNFGWWLVISFEVLLIQPQEGIFHSGGLGGGLQTQEGPPPRDSPRLAFGLALATESKGPPPPGGYCPEFRKASEKRFVEGLSHFKEAHFPRLPGATVNMMIVFPLLPCSFMIWFWLVMRRPPSNLPQNSGHTSCWRSQNSCYQHNAIDPNMFAIQNLILAEMHSLLKTTNTFLKILDMSDLLRRSYKDQIWNS